MSVALAYAEVDYDEQEQAETAALYYELSGLNDAIRYTWDRLVAAGATKRGSSKRAVSIVNAAGEDSEREVNRLWTELREMGARRKRIRAELKHTDTPTHEDSPMTEITAAPENRDAELETFGRKVAAAQAETIPETGVNWPAYGYAAEQAMRRSKPIPALAAYTHADTPAPTAAPAEARPRNAPALRVLKTRAPEPTRADTPAAADVRAELWRQLGAFLSALCVVLAAVLRVSAVGLRWVAAWLNERAQMITEDRAIRRALKEEKQQ